MTESLAGGCLCGAVRYRLASAPFDAGWCHCRTCQLNSGSPAMAFAKVPSRDFDGTTHDFSLATLDAPEEVTPEAHFYYASHIPWAEAADDLPRHPRGRDE